MTDRKLEIPCPNCNGLYLWRSEAPKPSKAFLGTWTVSIIVICRNCRWFEWQSKEV